MASLQDLHKSSSSLRTWRDHRIRLKFQSNSNQSIWLKASNRCKSLMHLQREKATRTKMSERHVVCRRIRPGRRTIDGSLADVFLFQPKFILVATVEGKSPAGRWWHELHTLRKWWLTFDWFENLYKLNYLSYRFEIDRIARGLCWVACEKKLEL